ncbi:MAG: ABC transporter permease [Burkholderiaceae bacterium]
MGRLVAMIVKELWAVLRDPRARIILVVPPVLQLILFSAAATLEVKNFDIGVDDRDQGAASTEFINQLAGSPNVRRLLRIASPQALRAAIDNRQVVAVVSFDEGFSRDVAAGRNATVHVTFDGRRSNAAQIIASYLTRIAASVGAVLKPGSRAGGDTVVTNWFNPNLDYLWFIMPSLLVTISAISAMSVTAQSVARERELGTFDQLMVSPLRIHEILIGKMTPPFLVGLFNGTVYLIVIPVFYGVPMMGSVPLFYGALAIYLLSVIGIGMVVSSVTQTQQQAFLGMFLVTVPTTLLSGFTSPVENMPTWLQWIAEANPLKHFLIISEGLFLKAMPAADVFANTWPLVVIAIVTLSTAVVQFRSRLE